MSARLHDTHVQALIRNAANGFAREPLSKGFQAVALHEFTDQIQLGLVRIERALHKQFFRSLEPVDAAAEVAA